MVGRGDLQETTRRIGEASLVVNMFVIKLWMCGLANSDSFTSCARVAIYIQHVPDVFIYFTFFETKTSLSLLFYFYRP